MPHANPLRGQPRDDEERHAQRRRIGLRALDRGDDVDCRHANHHGKEAEQREPWTPDELPRLFAELPRAPAVAVLLDTDLATGLDIERVRFAALFATDDQSIGMSAFVEKRAAEFTGN